MEAVLSCNQPVEAGKHIPLFAISAVNAEFMLRRDLMPELRSLGRFRYDSGLTVAESLSRATMSLGPAGSIVDP